MTMIHDLVELSGRDVEDEPTDGVLVRQERVGLDPGDGLPDVLVEVRECLGGPRRLDPGVVLDRLLELVVGEGEHAAVGVVDEDDLLGAKQPLADGQRADLVFGDHASGVG